MNIPEQFVLILMDELGLYDRDMIIHFCCMMLVEDTMFGSNDISYEAFTNVIRYRLEKIFNNYVADIVIHLTKPFVDNIQFFTKMKYNFYIEMVKKMKKAILGKMIDRLHNLAFFSRR